MLKYVFAFILLIHGLIHLMGFEKAFSYGNITQLTKEISKPTGMLWLLTAFLFIAATILFLVKKDAWIFVGLAAVIISQIIIFTVWKDAKFGTIANIIILVVAILSWGSYHFEKGYQQDVKENLQRTNMLKTDLLTETDLLPLPEPFIVAFIKNNRVGSSKKLYCSQVKGKKSFPFSLICPSNTMRIFFSLGLFSTPAYFR